MGKLWCKPGTLCNPALSSVTMAARTPRYTSQMLLKETGVGSASAASVVAFQLGLFKHFWESVMVPPSGFAAQCQAASPVTARPRS